MSESSVLSRPDSRLGDYALCLSLGAWAMMLCLSVGLLPDWLNQWEEVLWLGVMPGMLLVALVLGVAALMRRGRRKKLAVLGLLVTLLVAATFYASMLFIGMAPKPMV